MSRVAEVNSIISGVKDMDTGWRKTENVIMAINAILLGYQVVIGKTLGRSFGGMTQMLLKEVGDLLSEIVDKLTGDGVEYTEENIKEAIRRSLVETGIAKEVIIEELPPEEKHGALLRRFRIRVKDSMFKPIYSILVQKGFTEFPLSPEGMLIAAVVLRILKKSNRDARLNMKAKLPRADEEDLEIVLEEIRPMKR